MDDGLPLPRSPRGQLRGITDYGRMVDVNLAREIAAMMMQGEPMQPQSGSSLPQPRLGMDMAGGSRRKTQSGINGLNHRQPKSSVPSRDLARGGSQNGTVQTVNQ